MLFSWQRTALKAQNASLKHANEINESNVLSIKLIFIMISSKPVKKRKTLYPIMS